MRSRQRENQPKVSVIVPTYKRNEELARAIESVVNQTYNDWELIVINDDPETDIGDILPADNRITHLQHEENKGAPVARNNGILESNGEYIALLDDDDKWKPIKLELQIDRLDQLGEDFGLIYTGRDIIQDSGNVETFIPDKEGWVHKDLLHQNFIPSETPLIRRECFSCVGLFDPAFQSEQDFDLWLRIANKYKIGAVHESLAVSYKNHENRISTNQERKYHGRKQLLRKHRSSFESNSIALSKQQRRVGLAAVRSGRTLEGATQLMCSFRRDPRNVSLLVYLTMCLFPYPMQERLFKFRDRIIQQYLS
ncbi:glycosyltransferase [Haloarcula hispanica]|uniref:Glycosyltransferase n=1 Tax=Haloarcula hispanica TaxID=51589 RepID=A0A5J5LKG7_HALHI|nr:glycosyltransferase [Haloarcula hispanica]KAA9409950.1 glycosyltransferase [Haloarcula hispanica]